MSTETYKSVEFEKFKIKLTDEQVYQISLIFLTRGWNKQQKSQFLLNLHNDQNEVSKIKEIFDLEVAVMVSYSQKTIKQGNVHTHPGQTLVGSPFDSLSVFNAAVDRANTQLNAYNEAEGTTQIDDPALLYQYQYILDMHTRLYANYQSVVSICDRN